MMRAMHVEPARHGAKGVDTIIPFNPSLCNRLRDAGYLFAVRYLGALRDYERDVILESGLALLAVGYSRRAGWLPSADVGLTDGLAAVAHAKEAGLPVGMTLYCDLEGPGGDASQSCVYYVNAWAHAVQSAGYVAGLYVGYGVRLTPEQLYHDLAVTGYWHSCSKVQDVAVRGYQMIQQYPGNQKVCGVQVDIDVIQKDQLGDTPNWLVGD